MLNTDTVLNTWDRFYLYLTSAEWLSALQARLAHVNPQVLFITVLAIFLGWRITGKIKEASKASKAGRTLDAPGFPSIESLENFDWKTMEPIKLRPFKPKYHLTMALETLPASELIPMDKTYKDRLAHRRSLFMQHCDTVVAINTSDNKAGSNPRIHDAVSELYTFLLGTYLPGRYPTMFKLHRTQFASGMTVMMENLVTGEVWPVNRGDETGSEAAGGNQYSLTMRELETILKTVDEDILILLPERTGNTEDKENEKTETNSPRDTAAATMEDDASHYYILEAFVTCYPSGFDPRKKLGKRLAAIHDPVPGYPEKLEKSMDRFFDKLEVGRYVKRVNWSITTDVDLFSAFSGNVHGNDGEELVALKLEELDLDKTVLRCERQTLHRLPISKALVFAFHTYTYPIAEIKAEGLGEDLATAIDGLKKGSNPQTHFYKRGPVWGEAVKEFLRS